MGWRFDLKHANTVAYLTVQTQRDPPRVSKRNLEEFLGSIQGEYRERPPLFSSDRRWVEHVVGMARDAAVWLQSQRFEEGLLDSSVVTQALHDLREEFSCFDLYGLAVGTWHDQDELRAFTEHAAFSSGRKGLFLLPDLSGKNEPLAVFDPSPIAKQFISSPDKWPGMLFWLRSGEVAFAALSEAYGLYQRLLDLMRGVRWQESAKRVISEFNSHNERKGVKRLLHLSDLHFGRKEALRNQAYLSTHLQTKLESIDRVVVTGDLFDNPRKRDALSFRAFRAQLEASTGKDLIVIPGNHDQRKFGNSIFGLGRQLQELTELEWSNMVVDDDLACVFYCFDSSRDISKFACGHVSRDQMIELATAFETKVVKKPSLREYLPIALVHHHPYSFETRRETLLQKSLGAFNLSDESFLKMDNAEEFLAWCAGRRIPLILHGHKHVQRHVSDSIRWEHGRQNDYREVTAIGCGTSLGAENMALSYNILEWSPSIGKWSTSFFSDPGSGTGFEEIYVAMHSVERD